MFQGAFRSFLELACHCVVLDLFDDELLEAIAYDPEAWIDQLLRDDRFKVIIVCSQVSQIKMALKWPKMTLKTCTYFEIVEL